MSKEEEDAAFLFPEDLGSELAAAALKTFMETGELTHGASLMSLEEYSAVGREPDCDCGHIQCVCKLSRAHKQNCPFRVATVIMGMMFAHNVILALVKSAS